MRKSVAVLVFLCMMSISGSLLAAAPPVAPKESDYPEISRRRTVEKTTTVQRTGSRRGWGRRRGKRVVKRIRRVGVLRVFRLRRRCG